MKIALGISEGEVQLFLDKIGRDQLVNELKELEFPKGNKSHEHIHFMSEDWGNGDLSVLNKATCDQLKLEPVHHLKVLMRPSKKDVWKE